MTCPEPHHAWDDHVARTAPTWSEETLDRIADMVALRRLAYHLGFDRVGDAIVKDERIEASDMGVDLDDIEHLIDAAERVGPTQTEAAGWLVAASSSEDARIENQRARRRA